MSETIVDEKLDEDGRFRIRSVGDAHPHTDDGGDVVDGLTATPKTLPARYFYDDHGSHLFEAITDQPEYYPTRTEEANLLEYADELAPLTRSCDLIELGSGSSRKTRTLLDAYRSAGRAVRYMPIDVSAGMLKASGHTIRDDYPEFDVWGLVGTYEEALAGLPARELPQRMIIFLGSSIGNMEPAEMVDFLADLRRALKTGEHFLVGTDLVKDPAVLEAAYNDAAGVTALFNLNMLRHLNKRFDGTFDLDGFEHDAIFNREDSQIEMHLRSLSAQTARLEKLDLEVSFEAGETIRTEISRKFRVDVLRESLGDAGFKMIESWTDPRNYFALSLFRAV